MWRPPIGTRRSGFRGVIVNSEGASPTFSITSSRSMRTVVEPGLVSQPAAFRTSRASWLRNSIPISSSTRIAPSCIACTCSAPSGSVGASRFSGISQGICRIAGPVPRRLAPCPPDRRERRRVPPSSVSTSCPLLCGVRPSSEPRCLTIGLPSARSASESTRPQWRRGAREGWLCFRHRCFRLGEPAAVDPLRRCPRSMRWRIASREASWSPLTT